MSLSVEDLGLANQRKGEVAGEKVWKVMCLFCATRGRGSAGRGCGQNIGTPAASETDRHSPPALANGVSDSRSILPDGRNLGHEIVRAGLAWWFERYAQRDPVPPKLECETGTRGASYGRTRGRCRRGSGGRI